MDEENNTALLWELNEKQALDNLPIILYLGILSILGFVGNLHVLCVYTISLKPTENYRIFVLFLAGLDIVASTLVMPFDVFVFRYPYTFEYKDTCKAFNFFKATMIVGSALMLLVIAVERFQKICKPFGWQMTTKTATIACVMATFTAMILAWPNSVFKGHATKNLTNGIIGVECDIDDYYTRSASKFPVMYYGLLFAIYVTFTISLIVLYSLIGSALYKHAQMKKAKLNYKTKDISAIQNTTSSGNGQLRETESTELSTDAKPSIAGKSVTLESKISRIKPVTVKKVKAWDTMTKILFVITLSFTLTFLPHLILVPVTVLSKSFKSNLGTAQWVVYSIFRKFFYLNHMANPIIYGFFDTTFRNICVGFYRKIFRCRTYAVN